LIAANTIPTDAPAAIIIIAIIINVATTDRTLQSFLSSCIGILKNIYSQMKINKSAKIFSYTSEELYVGCRLRFIVGKGV